jgi:hypothetical protein
MDLRPVFWNQEERRMRSGWRLAVQFLGQLALFLALYLGGVRLLGPLAGGDAATPAMDALGLSHTGHSRRPLVR